MIEQLLGPERRRRRSPQEKIAIVQETLQPGMTVSHVARLHGVNANQIFAWRRCCSRLRTCGGGETNQRAAAPAG